jgi:hypothetical protein
MAECREAVEFEGIGLAHLLSDPGQDGGRKSLFRGEVVAGYLGETGDELEAQAMKTLRQKADGWIDKKRSLRDDDGAVEDGWKREGGGSIAERGRRTKSEEEGPHAIGNREEGRVTLVKG